VGRSAVDVGVVAGLRERRTLSEVAQAWVEESCVAQGVTAKLANIDVVEKVAVLLAAGRERTTSPVDHERPAGTVV